MEGKDVFEAFYKKDLAKRLLLQASASMDAEKSMLSKLKTECGAAFTNKLEGMFKDMETSKDVMEEFKAHKEGQALLPPGLALNVQVLTSGFWPTYPVLECRLPEPLVAAQRVFEAFYTTKHSGRNMAWHNALGQATLRAHFPSGSKDLSVSQLQAMVLCLFNEADQLTFQQIQEATQLERGELERTVLSLSVGKYMLLVKAPKGKTVNPQDTFTFNAKFSDPKVKLKINTIQMKESAEEHRKTNEQVQQDRQHQIDAAIVRIMKMRKSLSHQLLMGELAKQLKFQLVTSDVKKRIESLIEREYLERDADEKDQYKYLA